MTKRKKTVDDLLMLGYQKQNLSDRGKLSNPSSEGRETADWLFARNCGKEYNTETQCKKKISNLLKRAKEEQKLKIIKKYDLNSYYTNLIHELEDYKKKAKLYMR